MILGLSAKPAGPPGRVRVGARRLSLRVIFLLSLLRQFESFRSSPIVLEFPAPALIIMKSSRDLQEDSGASLRQASGPGGARRA
eukprot:766594-Hanusia_phi.AAC.2